MSEADPVPGQGFDWRPALYLLTGISFLLLIASLAGDGTGLFGWGFMMAGMWTWILLVLASTVLVGYLLGQRRSSES